jgi:hypothetical protein
VTTKETVIGLDCDPSCKYKSAANDLEIARTARLDAVPQEPHAAGSPVRRPTPEGYAMDTQIREEYRGLTAIEAVGNNCVRACAIERYLDANPDRDFGTEVQVMINNVKGE